jgi:hypothetical protein
MKEISSTKKATEGKVRVFQGDARLHFLKLFLETKPLTADLR